MAATGITRIVPLVLGWERLPKSFSVYGDTSGLMLIEPVSALLVERADRWLLLDTGLNPALIHDEGLYRRLHGRNHDITPILPPGPGDPLLCALAQAGVELQQLDAVILSHLHNDHAGGLRLIPRSVPVHVQRAELEYGLSGHPFPEQHGMFRIDFDDPEIDWRLADGDGEIVPGITAVFTPGHTPGHQSFVVEMDDEAGGHGFVFAFDAADLKENVRDEKAVGGFVHCEAQDTLDSILKLKAVAARHGYPIFPGHDPEVWPQLLTTPVEQWAAAGA